MARIDSRLLFLTTSPRTPEKMIPEIGILDKHFKGCKWNHETQCKFMEILRDEDFFQGSGTNDPAFSARDRINRAPQSLGLVTLQPSIQLTPAGKQLLAREHTSEVLLRQILKFQLPSPYHKPSEKAAKFWVKPYLEILRLIRTLGTLKFDELQIFGMQLTDYRNFDKIVAKIEKFRNDLATHEGSYRVFKGKYLHDELTGVYDERIRSGKTKTRESTDASVDNFLRTQANNLRDYADACFRYLRATGLVCVSHVGKSLSIMPERIDEVDFILSSLDRDPVFIDDKPAYIKYLGDNLLPLLLSDNRELFISKFKKLFPQETLSATTSLEQLKVRFNQLIEKRRQKAINQQIEDIKKYHQYDDIQATYEQITQNALFDGPLMLEWNTWRAMTMLDGGNIKANLNVDDSGIPTATATGNQPDIVCDYGDFYVSVEVTLSNASRQFEMEGESVMRHLGKLKISTDKPCYCLFIAPHINPSCVAFFYLLYLQDLKIYGGKLAIVPLPLNIFRKMIEDSYKSSYSPTPNHIKTFFDDVIHLANDSSNESTWFEAVKDRALHWLDNA